MPAIEQTRQHYRCPECRRLVRPEILEHVDAIPNAVPSIPARLRVTCPALMLKDGRMQPCGGEWYLVADADK